MKLATAAAAWVLAATLTQALSQTLEPAPASTLPLPERQTRHALIIAIGEYTDAAIPVLKGIPFDVISARQMAAAMGVPAAQVTVLRDEAATAARIRSEIDALNGRVRDGDRVFVYYSGHGTRWFDAAQKDEGCTEGLMASDGQVLGSAELARRLAPLAQRADKMLVFYDACFSGGVAGAPLRTRTLALGAEQLTPKFTRAGAPDFCAQPSNFRTRSLAAGLPQAVGQASQWAQNVVHVAASRPDEASFDSSTRGGFATASWRDCLLGQAQDLDGSGAITAEEVTRCAQARIDRELAGQPGITGQKMTLAGNPAFVPAWMGERFAPTAAPPVAGAGVVVAPAPQATPPAAPAHVLAEVHGQRDGSRGVVATVRKAQLKVGVDGLELDITPARDGYLYVALAGSDGQSLYLLYPNGLAANNRVQAGRRVSLPGAGWEIVAAGPPGTETLLVMVTDAPRDLSGLAREPAGPFMKTLLDGQGRARLQAVLGNGTPAAGCGRPGVPSCSDAFGATLLQVQTVP